MTNFEYVNGFNKKKKKYVNDIYIYIYIYFRIM